MNYLRRIVRKLHIERSYYNVTKLFLRDNTNLPSDRDARDLLKKYTPKPCGSSIGNNRVIIPPKYDLMIVVAAYNAEAYLEKCLDSVMNQQTNYAVLTRVVNDGSSDRTAEILEQYQKKHPQNIEVITQNNRGLSCARNAAIKNIPSHYIMFLDADDKLEEGSIELLLTKAFRQQADIVEGNYFLFRDDGEKRFPIRNKHKDAIYDSAYNHIYGFACMKVIRSSLFDSVIFPDGFWFEDTIISMLLFPRVKKVVTVSPFIYAYRSNPKGITSSAVQNPKSIDSYWILEQLLEDLPEHNLPYNEDQFQQVLRQIVINQSRAFKLPEEIQKALFVCGAALIKKYFNDANDVRSFWLREVSESLQRHSFYRFCLLCDVGSFEKL